MKTSQFDAKTFGLGELISQRKLFRVPSHQRSYSWARESVESFLEDIRDSFESKSSEYFVGLIVIQGPEDGEWILLDGQQRLTTVTMIYSSIRNWLRIKGMERDADQIEGEFLSVRKLGGEVSPRMLLNQENMQAYNECIVASTEIGDLQAAASRYPKRSSNRLLVEAAIFCQSWVTKLASDCESEGISGENKLFQLASFLEAHLKAVSVEVSSDVDAYVLFESLNDRGVELSALDLLKNYLYSRLQGQDRDAFEDKWSSIIDLLEDSNPDDFLKVFWTARNGVVQKNQLFRRIKENYSSSALSAELVDELARDALLLSAIDDDRHPYWNDRDPSIRERVKVLNTLGSKQTRPVILAALLRFSDSEVSDLLRRLIVSVVRYQIIGRGRTGVVERVLARICQQISNGHAVSAAEVQRYLQELYTQDEEFVQDFAHHVETKLVRNNYFLWMTCPEYFDRISLSDALNEFALDRLFLPEHLGHEFRHSQQLGAIGNYILSAKNGNALLEANAAERDRMLAFFGGTSPEKILSGIASRSMEMARRANLQWRFDVSEVN